MPGNQKLSVSIKNMGFMKRSIEKVGEETGESRKRKRELQIFEKQWAGDQYNNKKETASGLIIVKDNRSQYSYGRKSFNGYNKPIENKTARNKLKPSPVKDSKKQKRKVTPASKKSKD